MNGPFRLLQADEIECRVSQCTSKGYSLLLYKDARCDMNILDESVGSMNWQRHHEVVNGKEFCTVSLLNSNGIWVSKQDCGTKSYTEAEKGESSDAFKRACVNWGIGRELYTAPFIWINGGVKKNPKKEGTYIPEDKVQSFVVSAIEYDNKNRICGIAIVDGNGVLKFAYGTVKGDKSLTKNDASKKNSEITAEMIGDLLVLADQTGTNREKMLSAYGVDNAYHLTTKQYQDAMRVLKTKVCMQICLT